MITDRELVQIKKTLSRVPYFEHPAHFKDGKNNYYGNKNVAGENHVFLTMEDFVSSSDVFYPPTQRFCFVHETNKNNRWNRQYVKTEENRYFDITSQWELNVGDRFRSSKIAQIFTFSEFCEYLSTNKHDNVLSKLESDE